MSTTRHRVHTQARTSSEPEGGERPRRNAEQPAGADRGKDRSLHANAVGPPAAQPPAVSQTPETGGVQHGDWSLRWRLTHNGISNIWLGNQDRLCPACS